MTADLHTILSTQQLTIGYQTGKTQLPIIEDINVQANAGELICFMGPNGVGKSTLLRTICGLQDPLMGTITINNQPVDSIKAKEFSKLISLVLTDRINVGNMSAYDLVVMGRYPYLGWNVKIATEDQQHIDQAIALTNVSHYINKRVYELSDGQLQKVMIARALAQDTPLMILDEPTAHLDLNNRVAVVNLLRNLAHQKNKTIIIATHELDLALQTADKLWLAGSKKSIVQGMPEDLVLNGAIDKVFQFKGYDLKTGTLEKQSFGYKINLRGTGHTHLWTKNALERNGFEIDAAATYSITIHENDNGISWQLNNDSTLYHDLKSLIEKAFNLY